MPKDPTNVNLMFVKHKDETYVSVATLWTFLYKCREYGYTTQQAAHIVKAAIPKRFDVQQGTTVLHDQLEDQ